MFFGFAADTFRRVPAVILCILFLCAAAAFADESKWDGKTLSSPNEGDGSAENPYIIDSAAKLAGLANWAKNKDRSAKEHYLLTTDVDLAGMRWTPIGEVAAPFQGFFRGGGHIVRGMSINALKADNQGLFGYVQSADISELGLISARIEIGTGQYAGGLVGRTKASALKNVFVFGWISGGTSVGGIAGRIEETSVLNCFSAASVSGNGSFIGGLIGASTPFYDEGSVVRGCHANGTTTGPAKNAAGLLGNHRTYCLLTDSYAAGNVRTLQDHGAGAVAHATQESVAENIVFDSQGTGQSAAIAAGEGVASNVLAVSADSLASGLLPAQLSAGRFSASPDAFPQLLSFRNHPNGAFRDASALSAVPLFFTPLSTSLSSDGVLKAPTRDSEGNELRWNLREGVGFALESGEPNRVILLLTHGEKRFDVSNRLRGASKEFFVSADVRQGARLTLTTGLGASSCKARLRYNGADVGHAVIRFTVSGDNTGYTASADLPANARGIAKFRIPDDALAGSYDVRAEVPSLSCESDSLKLEISARKPDSDVQPPVDESEKPGGTEAVLPEDAVVEPGDAPEGGTAWVAAPMCDAGAGAFLSLFIIAFKFASRRKL